MRRWSQPSNHPAADPPAIGWPQILELQAGLGVVANPRRIAGRGRHGELAAHRRGDQVAGLDLRVDVEIGDGGALEDVPGVGVGGVERGVEVAVGGRQGEERPAVGVVTEQLLDQPAGDRVPVLGEQREGGELGVLPQAAAAGVRIPDGSPRRRLATVTRSATGMPVWAATSPAYSVRTLTSGCSLTTPSPAGRGRARSSGVRAARGRRRGAAGRPGTAPIGDGGGERGRIALGELAGIDAVGQAGHPTWTWYFCSHS